MRSLTALMIALTISSCHIQTPTLTPVPTPPPPAPSNVFCIAPVVFDISTNRPIQGANEFVDKLNGQSDVNGYHYFFPVPMPNVLNIFAASYQDYSEKIDIESLSCNHAVFMTPKHGPRPTRAQTMNIKANFLSMHDGLGRLMFSWFYTTLGQADRSLWRLAWQTGGYTHAVLDFNVAYPNYWAPSGDFRGAPQQVVAAASELLDNKIIPIVMMTTGDAGTQPEVDTMWSSYINAMRQAEPCMIGEGGDPCAILVPGFETGGPCSAWSAADISHALTTLHNLAPSATIGYEPCPTRFSGASNPVQPDDPWQGAEAGFFTSHGGEFINVFLYETVHGDPLLNPHGATGQFCHIKGQDPCGAWEDRWSEGLQRLCTGGIGWRLVPCSFFEVTGSDYKGGDVSDATVTRINNRALRLCQQYGATCSWGNGTPTNPQ